jgi:hypothetical protein
VRYVEEEAFEAGAGENESVGLSLAHLADACIDVPPDIHDPQVRAAVEELCAAPQAGGSNDCPLRQAVHVPARVGDEDIRRIVALGDCREGYALRNLDRHVFCGVDGQVYLSEQERLVELAGKDIALVYYREWQVRVMFAGGLDDPNLDR